MYSFILFSADSYFQYVKNTNLLQTTGGGSGNGGEKNITRSVARCGDFSQAACYTLVRYAFSRISE